MSQERALAALTGVPHRVVRHGPVSCLEEAAAGADGVTAVLLAKDAFAALDALVADVTESE